MKAIYLDYINNYLTVSRMAECYGVDKIEMLQMIEKGRIEYEKSLENIKQTDENHYSIYV